MPESPSRLDLLHFLERVQRADLDRTRRWIADEQRREAEQQRRAKRRPAPPDWILEYAIGVGKQPIAVHIGGCLVAGRRVRAVTRDQAVQAIREGVDGCGECRPDADLDVLG